MQIALGRNCRGWIGRTLGALLCLSLLVWSLAPSFTHTASFFQDISERSEIIAEHGHAHDDVLDNYWAAHGHSHDAADHDHSSAILIRNADARPKDRPPLPRALEPVRNTLNPIYTLERPPQV